MKEKRKMAHRRNDAPQHQNKSIKSSTICLILFIASQACMIAGKTINNDAIKFFGMGMAFAILILITHDNLKEDRE